MCAAACGDQLVASCHCYNFVTAAGTNVELPICSCSPSSAMGAGDIDKVEFYLEATEDQLNDIETFRVDIIDDVDNDLLAQELSDDLEIIQKAFKSNNYFMYLAAIQSFTENYKMVPTQ